MLRTNRYSSIRSEKPLRPSNRFRRKTLYENPAESHVGLETLEQRVLLSASVHDHSDDAACLFPEYHEAIVSSLNDDASDRGYLDDSPASPPRGPLHLHESTHLSSAGRYYDLDQTFELHSLPGATKTVYLDFDGHTTTEYWDDEHNNGNPIVTPAYNFEGSSSSFTEDELKRIQRIWERVAEDFLPFNVNVTTEDPGNAALVRSSGSDNEYGIRVVIGGDGDWYEDGQWGGVANYHSFWEYLSWWEELIGTELAEDAFVFAEGKSEKTVAEAISHEVGHSMNLRHDGQGSEDYYTGHGSGDTGWAPIMGVGYYENLTQWSKGEYSGATNTEDDLNIITTQNGFGYRTDDHGNSRGSASDVVYYGSNILAEGIIERNTDVDYFEFTTSGGHVELNIDPFYRGPNLDILAKLYTSSGSVIATSNPSSALDASFNLALDTGTYYISVEGTGKGSDYSGYGSLGYFSITGIVPQYSSGQIDFGDHTIVNYSGSQTGSGSTTVENDGASIRLYGNQWKAIDFEYTITADTVLEFDFFSGAQGEQHAIGLDNDLGNNHHAFSLFGTQSTDDFEQYKTYITDAGLQHYVIPVGQYYTGSMDYMYFIMDHDGGSSGESIFSNVRVYEDTSRINFTGETLYNITNQNGTGTTTVTNDGMSLHMVGNQWKAIALDYTVTENTVIEFDFQSDSEGELHGLGFDTDLSSSHNSFVLYGDQRDTNEIGAFGTYSSYDPYIKHYTIPVGQFYTGNMNYLYFMMDHDVTSPTGESIFSNVKVYESVPQVNFANGSIVNYSGSQTGSGSTTVLDDGRSLRLYGNQWKAIAFDYDVNENTVIEFDFTSSSEGDQHAIGLDNDLNNNHHAFSVYGWQVTDDFQDFSDYDDTAPDTKHYVIPVGQYYTGSKDYLYFIMDHDTGSPNGESIFSNVRVYDSAVVSGMMMSMMAGGGGGSQSLMMASVSEEPATTTTQTNTTQPTRGNRNVNYAALVNLLASQDGWQNLSSASRASIFDVASAILYGDQTAGLPTSNSTVERGRRVKLLL